jgi:LCP family protein required for cell wall assembly
LRDAAARAIFLDMSAEPVTPPQRDAAPRLLVLNAIFPGLGHLVAGRRLWALGLALPVLVVVGIVLIVAARGNVTSLAVRMFDPAVLGALLGVQALLLLWRLGALGAVRIITPLRPTYRTLLAGAFAIVIVVAPQLYLAGLTLDARDAAADVFQPVNEGGAWVSNATAPPVASNDPVFAEEPSASPSDAASASPSASPTPGVPRVNVLLIGTDSGVGRTTALTDTMIVASLDPVGKTVSMVSVPRDMVDVPLPDGRSFRAKINSLVSYVRWHKDKFPGAKDGQSVLAAALGELLQIKIDMWAQVNLGGFVSLVDSVGGVTINVTDSFCDPHYKEYGIKGFNITPGRYHFDGQHALAYARIRKAAGESDFTRAGRQQEVIGGLRDRIVKGAFLDDPAKFLRGVGRTIQTNIKPSVIADYIDIAQAVGRSDTFRVVINHPLVRGTSDQRGSIQVPNLAAIRAMAARLFTPTGVRPTGFDTMPSAGSGPTRAASSASTCGIAPPKATPKATPKPTAKPTNAATATTPPTPEPTTPPTPQPTPEPTPTPTG